METKYPTYIMKRLRQNLGLEPDDTSGDKEIDIMSPGEVVDRVLEWEGIIGYSSLITDLIFGDYGFDKEN